MAESLIKVSIAVPQEIVPINKPYFKQLVQAVLEEEGVKRASISLAYVDDPTIHRLNNQFLEHDEPTDVLSFPMGKGKSGMEGELVIGVEVARRVAREEGHDEKAELALYTIHGLLHLVGYDDKSFTKAIKMREAERHHLKALGLPDIAPRLKKKK